MVPRGRWRERSVRLSSMWGPPQEAPLGAERRWTFQMRGRAHERILRSSRDRRALQNAHRGAWCWWPRRQAQRAPGLLEVVPGPVGGTRAWEFVTGSGTSWPNAPRGALVARRALARAVGTRRSVCGPPQEDPRPARGLGVFSSRARARRAQRLCQRPSARRRGHRPTEPELAQPLRAGTRRVKKR